MSPETRAKLLVGDDDEAQTIAAEFFRQRGRAAGRRPTKGQINELAERLKLAWHQGASVAELEALAGELAAGRGW
jgi:hypothetical protein